MLTTYFSDRSFLPPGTIHQALLYPFWGEIPEPVDTPDAHRMKKLSEQGSGYYRITENPKEAQAGLLPFAFLKTETCLDYTRRMAAVCSAAGIPLIVLYNADDDAPVDIPGVRLFRTSALASQSSAHVYGLPAWSADFARYYPAEEIQYIDYTPRPAVSYCGYVDYLQPFHQVGTRLKRAVAYRLGKRNRSQDQGLLLRGQAVRNLLADSDIDTRLIIRDGFWGGKISSTEARAEYAKNMQESPYALTVRGAGNFSYRLYEVMSSGRIPVFINTDCLLPFSTWIDWKAQMVWVESNELADLANKIKAFHRQHNAESLIALQKKNRQIYEEWLSPLGFAKNLYRILDQP